MRTKNRAWAPTTAVGRLMRNALPAAVVGPTTARPRNARTRPAGRMPRRRNRNGLPPCTPNRTVGATCNRLVAMPLQTQSALSTTGQDDHADDRRDDAGHDEGHDQEDERDARRRAREQRER